MSRLRGSKYLRSSDNFCLHGSLKSLQAMILLLCFEIWLAVWLSVNSLYGSGQFTEINFIQRSLRTLAFQFCRAFDSMQQMDDHY